MLVFVCWGNICRSPMAERVARKLVAEQGIGLQVESFGLSGEELGNPIDRRAAAVLQAAGYDSAGHRARKIGPSEVAAADLVVAAEPFHVDQLHRMCPEAQVALLNDFNPKLPPGTPLRDPWYGPADGFEETLADVEAAMPGILQTLLEAKRD